MTGPGGTCAEGRAYNDKGTDKEKKKAAAEKFLLFG